MNSTTQVTSGAASCKVKTHVDILIIGSGFAGLGMGIQLARKTQKSFLILERASAVGGTWRDNHYPGIACDVPSHLYCFSFLPNPEWSRVFSPGEEIQEYLLRCARDEGLLSSIRFNTEMLEARWNDTEKKWFVTSSQGIFSSSILITGAGHLADGHLPSIEGLSSFKGETFHSANWNHDAQLAGKRIGVVGSGASAIQIVPEMTKLAKQLVVFQRSACYVIPRHNRDYEEREKQLFRRDPETITELRSDLFWTGEYNFAQRRNVPRFVAEGKKMALDHLQRQVEDPVLRKKLTPDYEIGCKRVLISNDYFPSLTQDHVVLETSALAKVSDAAAISAKGNQYELDVLIFATGFEATRPPFAKRVYGRSGISLDAQWSQGMQAYDTIAVHDFPNLFIMNGPNTGLGHNSVVYVIEAQIDYILEALQYGDQHGIAVFEASAAAENHYMDALQNRSQGTVWLAGGCKSWYVDKRSQRLTLVWPDYAHAFRDENGHFHPEGYLNTPATTAG